MDRKWVGKSPRWADRPGRLQGSEGKPELALGSINWLMHENRWAWVRTLFLLAGVAGVILLVLLASGLPRPQVLVSLAVALLAFAGTARVLDAWVARWSSLPQPPRRSARRAPRLRRGGRSPWASRSATARSSSPRR